jgi:hypothetical protein
VKYEAARNPEDREAAPGLDSWRADVGDEAIAAIVAETQRRIELGLLPGFSTRAELHAFLDRTHAQPT